MSDDKFPLKIEVDADEYALLTRRAASLEAFAVHVLRDNMAVKEWFTAAEIASLRLPSVPATAAGVRRVADSHAWYRRTGHGRGGRRNESHPGRLRQRAVNELVRRLWEGETTLAAQVDVAPAIPAPPAQSLPENAEPPWLLPFMRLLKGEAEGDVSTAWKHLPKVLPRGVSLPSEEEAAVVILRLGLVADG